MWRIFEGLRFGFGRKTRAAGLLVASALSAPVLAVAQEGPPAPAQPAATSSDSGEVVITARRRAESSQKVPIAVIALSSKQLTEQGVTTQNDLARVAPGLSIMNTAASRAAVTYSIRGQGSTFGSGPGVIPYFAEVANFSPLIFDLQNVQVLKGPQGTLFGRNTTGGAVLFTPQMPSNDFTGYIDTRLGNYDRRDLEFGVGGAIVPDKVMFRIAGQSLNRDGYTSLFDGVTTHNNLLDNENKQGIRAILRIDPVDGLENDTIFQATRIHEHGDGAILSHVTLSGSPLDPLLSTALAEQQALGIRTAMGEAPFKFVSDTDGVINTTTWRLNDNISLKNIASYLRTKGEKDWDLDGTNDPLLGVFNPPSKNEQMTEELQALFNFGIVSGTAGYYYERTLSPFQVAFVENSPILFAPAAGVVVAEGQSTISQGPYAQADWKLTPQFNVTTGIRYTTDSLSSKPIGNETVFATPDPGVSADDFTFAPPFGSITPPPPKKQFNTVTWNVAADYAINPQMNVYGHVTRGYKQGGFNGTAPASLQSFQPEFVTDYELGLKGQHRLGGWLVRYDLDAFYDKYKNIQRNENVLNPDPPHNVLTVIQNAAAGSIKGVELQVTVQPSPIFQLGAAYTHLDAKYSSYTDPLAGDISQSRFPNTPTDQLTITPIVTFPVSEDVGVITAQANIYYQTSFATDAFNVPNGNPLVDLDVPGANAPGYTRVDLRADWRHIYRTPVSVGLYGQNVFNEKYIVGTDNQLNTFGIQTQLYSAPAFYGVELRYDFGSSSH